jgi:hypothetical protein
VGCVREFLRPSGSRFRRPTHTRLDLEEALTRSDLRLFLATAGTGEGEVAKPRTRKGDLSDRYAWRMLHLVDRVLSFGLSKSGEHATTAARELMQEEPFRYANAGDRDPVAEVLADADARRLIGHVTAIRSQELDVSFSWKEARDRTAVALMLGAGLSPGDLRALEMTGVTIEVARSRIFLGA